MTKRMTLTRSVSWVLALGVLIASLGAITARAQVDGRENGDRDQVRNVPITRDLSRGMEGNDVRTLQVFLIEQATGIYPEALVTGTYGPLTQRAVERFQEREDIAQEGDPGYGVVGPATRARMNELMRQDKMEGDRNGNGVMDDRNA